MPDAVRESLGFILKPFRNPSLLPRTSFSQQKDFPRTLWTEPCFPSVPFPSMNTSVISLLKKGTVYCQHMGGMCAFSLPHRLSYVKESKEGEDLEPKFMQNSNAQSLSWF